MALAQSFLDEVQARTLLSSLIGRSVKLTRAGREWRGCCPFHQEKTPSFYVNDDKGFAHCFGCGWHGDAFRWLGEHDGVEFVDAVRQLAEAAGLAMPERSAAAEARAARIDGVRPALEAADALYRRELEACGAAREYLAGRGIDDAAIERFGIGWAPERRGHMKTLNIGLEAALAAGLAWQGQDDSGAARSGETFRGRIMVPVHDRRGRLIGFGGRALHPSESVPKYKNSPDSEIFDKGATLFNLHRAMPACRAAKRLIVVEGYLDAVALDQVGIAEVVAPMGTALTCGTAEAPGGQLEQIWRLSDRPILAFDGDAAGRRAAVRACIAALPHIGPSGGGMRSLAVALFPAGQDPDDVARAGGGAAVEAVLREAVALPRLLFDAVVAERLPDGVVEDPEAIAGVWHALDALGRTIRDEETRAQYLAGWRARFEREVSIAPDSAPALPALHALVPAAENETAKADERYFWPEAEDVSERHLIAIVRRCLEMRAARKEITEGLRDIMAVAKAAGFPPKQLNAVMRDIEADSGAREEGEAIWALYRRVLGVRGPMTEAMLPAAADARAPKVVSAATKRLSRAMVLIDAREVG